MLPCHVQSALASRYGGGKVKTAFDRGMLEGFQAEFAGEAAVHSSAIFVDIAGFSAKTDGRSPAEVRTYLDAYYEVALPGIFERGGMVDRIAGDGIIAVFSGFFQPSLAGANGEDVALQTAEAIVRSLRNSEHEAKAAVATGNLLFCKTGVAAIFEEFTVVGTPLTELYRIEEIASANEVVLRGDQPLGQRVWRDVQAHSRQPWPRRPAAWRVTNDTALLRGVNGGEAIELLREACIG